MTKFKKIAVLTDVFEMTRASSVNIKQKDSDAILTNRIQSLVDVLRKNRGYKLTRRWIQIKCEETALLQLEAGNLDWLDYALDELDFVCRTLKSDIKFPIGDDYRKAIIDEGRRGGVQLERKNDLISVLEDDIETLKGIEFKAPVEELKLVSPTAKKTSAKK